LEKYHLPYPEAIFDIDYFTENPAPFYTLAKELNPKKFRPTKTHQFFRLLEIKHKLKRCFTQNIDTLERLAGLSDELIVEAHGSFATSRCIECRSEMSDTQFIHQLDQIHPPDPLIVKCPQKRCLGKPTALIKPDIVFFGEQLPKKFFGSLPDFQEADLLIVLGTSLQVQPFASLISNVPMNCPRLLINLEAVGEVGRDNRGGFDFEGTYRGGKKFIRDVLVLGTTDDGIEELCDLLGWKDELLDLYDPERKLPGHGEDISSSKQGQVDRTAEGKDVVGEKVFEQKDDDDNDGQVACRAKSRSLDHDQPDVDHPPTRSPAVGNSHRGEDGQASQETEVKKDVEQLVATVSQLSVSEEIV